jgi:hypothetical protein
VQTSFHEDETMLFLPRLKGKGSLARHRQSGPRKLSVELLEDRTVPYGGGVTPSLVALGGAMPTPIPLSAASLFHDSADNGGPDVHLNLPGPVTAPPSTAALVPGNENNAITDFGGVRGGVYAGSAVIGTGTDDQGRTRYWVSDTRVMQGTYRGLDGNSHFGTFVEL